MEPWTASALGMDPPAKAAFACVSARCAPRRRLRGAHPSLFGDRLGRLKEEARHAAVAHLLVRVERLRRDFVVEPPRVNHQRARHGDPHRRQPEQHARERRDVVVLLCREERRQPDGHDAGHRGAGAALDIVDGVPRVSYTQVQRQPEDDRVVQVCLVQPARRCLVHERRRKRAQRRDDPNPHEREHDAGRRPGGHEPGVALAALGARRCVVEVTAQLPLQLGLDHRLVDQQPALLALCPQRAHGALAGSHCGLEGHVVRGRDDRSYLGSRVIQWAEDARAHAHGE
mmetsp:Transcript_32935/g.97035  ORF Transcript_32935/g.97035 Transcript_32935/m.97035 type:complete len:286 (+) Transcript_32935:358-1215(+)